MIQIYSRDAGKREAKLSFDVGQGTQDLGFRSEVDILFTCDPGVKVTLGRPATTTGSRRSASFLIRDAPGRVYPSQSRRLAPDFYFHPQIYRRAARRCCCRRGPTTSEVTRGPEYLVETRKITVPRRRRASRDVPPRALDGPGEDGLVLGRPPRPRRRLRPLREPDRGRHARAT